MTSNHNIQITSLGDQRENLVAKINSVDQNKIELLSDQISSGLVTLNKEYGKLKELSSPIVKNKHIWGLIETTDTEESIKNILKIIQDVANSTLTAFTTNGENLKAILELFRISVSIENDLYRQLEECDCSKENIANLLNDFCSQYNIDNEAISGLFEQSFNRSLTLRAKINRVRDEVSSQILDLNKDIENLDATLQERVQSFEQNLNQQAQSLHQFESEIQKFRNTIDDNDRKLETIKESLQNKVNSAIIEMKGSISQYQSEFSKLSESRFKLLESENSELRKNIETLNNNIEKISNRLACSLIISVVSIIIAIVCLTL